MGIVVAVGVGVGVGLNVGLGVGAQVAVAVGWRVGGVVAVAVGSAVRWGVGLESRTTVSAGSVAVWPVGVLTDSLSRVSAGSPAATGSTTAGPLGVGETTISVSVRKVPEVGSVVLVGIRRGCDSDMEGRPGVGREDKVVADEPELLIAGNKKGVGIGDGIKGIGLGISR